MYYDLNVVYPVSASLRSELVSVCARLGYDGVAYNHHVSHGRLTAKDTNTMQIVPMPAPSSVPPYATALRVRSLDASAARHHSAFTQLTRITITADDVATVNAMSAAASVLHSYDLVAVSPSSDAAFHAACQCDVLDIIVIDCASRLPFIVKRPAIHLATARGIHFELSYAPALRDPASRRYFFSTAMALMRLTKGKHVIVTSAAQRSSEVRSAYDVMNLARVLHMQNTAIAAVISVHCHTAIAHGQTRKHVDSAITAIQTQRTSQPQDESGRERDQSPLRARRSDDDASRRERKRSKLT